MTELGLALALVMVIEGSLWALFPAGMQRMLTALLRQPAVNLRWSGLGLAAVGYGLAWLIQT
jgi:hypothetical protein